MRFNQYRLCRAILKKDTKITNFYTENINQKLSQRRLTTVGTIIFRTDDPKKCACKYLYSSPQNKRLHISCYNNECRKTTIELSLKQIHNFKVVLFHYIKGTQ